MINAFVLGWFMAQFLGVYGVGVVCGSVATVLLGLGVKWLHDASKASKVHG